MSVRRLGIRLFVLLVKSAIAVALVILLVRQQRIDLQTIRAIRPGPMLYALIALACAGVFGGLLLMAWRLRLFLVQGRFDISYKDTLRLTLLGSFVGAVLPGLVGGDAVKAAYLCGQVEERRMDAVVAVMVDRAIGLYALFVLGGVASLIGLAAGILWLPKSVLFASPSIVALGLLAGALFSLDSVRNFPPLNTLGSKMPGMVRIFIRSIGDYLRSPRLVFSAIGISVLNHALVVLAFVCAAALIADPLSLLAHFVVDPLAMAMNVIPLTPGGIGIAESAFSYLYGSVGSGDGALVGLFGRLLQYFVFTLAGVPALIISRFSIWRMCFPEPGKQDEQVRKSNGESDLRVTTQGENGDAALGGPKGK